MVNLPHILSMRTDTNETINIIIDNHRINIHTDYCSISLSLQDAKRFKRKLNDIIKFYEINKELS